MEPSLDAAAKVTLSILLLPRCPTPTAAPRRLLLLISARERRAMAKKLEGLVLK